MGIFDQVEKRLEGAVNGVFARAFKGDVQPVEIAARLSRELDSEAKLLGHDRRLVPNDFTVTLSQHDYDRLAPYTKTLNSEIIPELRDHASERGYVFNGPIRISYMFDRELPTGRFTIDSQALAAIDEASGPIGVTPSAIQAPLVLEVNGVRHPLVPPGLVLGRGSEADLRINDPGVSRRHARISVVDDDGRLFITIDDLNSTNGVILNGHKVSTAELTDGSRLEIGSTRMLVHSPVGS